LTQHRKKVRKGPGVGEKRVEDASTENQKVSLLN